MAMKDVKPLVKTSVSSPVPGMAPPKPPAKDKHIWDLHGMTLDEAHQLAISQVQTHQGKSGSVTFITGKSGQMRNEFCHWLDREQGISRIESLNGGGAFRVWFKKIKNKKH
jgi:hypothetical protein